MARFVPLITDDPVTLVQEVLLFAVDTIDDYNQSVPAAYVFKRDARIAVDAIEPIIRQYAGFDEELRKYIENFDKEPTESDSMSAKDILLQGYEEGMNGEKHIIKAIIKIIDQTRMDLDKFLDDVKPCKSKSKRFSSQQFKAFGARLFQSSEILAQIEQQNREIQRLIDLLKTSNDLARRNEEPKLEQFRTKLLPEAFRFWERHIGQATWTDWDRFAQAYTALYGDFNTIDLNRIKEHLAVQEARIGDEPVTKMTLYGFIALTNTHGFPFVKNSQQLAMRRRELSPEARVEVAKMVLNLMDQFTSKEMQKSFLEIEKLYDGIGRKDEARIKEKAAE
ncbi:hypothetical protein BJV82DRAFT_239939 [Fennellomyces sp. T-0311]|nr:hypothetical protein BJV82DRAFT_239939 [Fennellomyces sp. T-0311]